MMLNSRIRFSFHLRIVLATAWFAGAGHLHAGSAGALTAESAERFSPIEALITADGKGDADLVESPDGSHFALRSDGGFKGWWKTAARLKIKGKIERGESLLLSFEARAAPPSTSAKLKVAFQGSLGKRVESATWTGKVGAEWERVELRFESKESYGGQQSVVRFDFGFDAQAIEVRDLGLFSLGKAGGESVAQVIPAYIERLRENGLAVAQARARRAFEDPLHAWLDYVDVSLPPYNADPSGEADATAAIRQAMEDVNARFEAPEGFRAERRPGVIYLPAGTYRISDTLAFGTARARYMQMRGDPSGETVLRLIDEAPGFGNPQQPKPVLSFIESDSSNISFSNEVDDLTIEVGAGNPGAVGLDYQNNNSGHVRRVSIRSLDPESRGHAGLRCPAALSGIGYLRDIEVEGFDHGLWFRDMKIAYVLENIRLSGQRVAGITSYSKPLAIRNLQSKNSVPALNLAGKGNLAVLLDSHLSTGADGGEVAIRCSEESVLFARNVEITGYGEGLRHGNEVLAPSALAEEVSAGGSFSLWEDTPERSLNLPVPETPAVPWSSPEAWAVIDGDRFTDDAAAIQKAVDAGTRDILLKGRIELKRTVHLRGPLQRLFSSEGYQGLGAHSSREIVPVGALLEEGGPLFHIHTGEAPALLIDSLHMSKYSPQNPAFLNESEADVRFRRMSVFPYRGYGSGRVFMEEIAGNMGSGAFEQQHTPMLSIHGQDVWIRHYNPEGADPHILNDGGRLWLLGAKLGEMNGPYLDLRNASRTEAFGLFFNALDRFAMTPEKPSILVDNSDAFIVAVEDNLFPETPNPAGILEIRGTDVRSAKGLLPARFDSGRGRMIPSYRANSAPERPLRRSPEHRLEASREVLIPGSSEEVAEVSLSLASPLPEDFRLHLVNTGTGSARSADFELETSLLEIPASEAKASIRLRATGANRGRGPKILTLEARGEDVWSTPFEPAAVTVEIQDTVVALERGLEFLLGWESGAWVDLSGSEQILVPVQVGHVQDGDEAIFGSGSSMRLGAERSNRGFMHNGFRERSVAAQVALETPTGANHIFSEGGHSGMEVFTREGELIFEVRITNTRTGRIAVPLPRNGRFHFVAVFNHGYMALYLDGKRVGTGLTELPVVPRHSRFGGIGMGRLEAGLQNFRIYDRAISDAEAAALARPFQSR